MHKQNMVNNKRKHEKLYWYVIQAHLCRWFFSWNVNNILRWKEKENQKLFIIFY